MPPIVVVSIVVAVSNAIVSIVVVSIVPVVVVSNAIFPIIYVDWIRIWSI